ncbi:hypothetical protein Q7P37_009252 [Cladosporium fusiforme]
MSRALKIGGVAAAAGAGYYFYQAGGDPKAAQKRFEADAAKLQHAAKNDAPTKGTEVRKDAEVLAADAGKEVDRLAAQARDGTHKVDQKLEDYRARAEKGLDQTIKQTGSELNKAVDAFDKNVAQGADKAKSGISSWFGSGNDPLPSQQPFTHQIISRQQQSDSRDLSYVPLQQGKTSSTNMAAMAIIRYIVLATLSLLISHATTVNAQPNPVPTTPDIDVPPFDCNPNIARVRPCLENRDANIFVVSTTTKQEAAATPDKIDSKTANSVHQETSSIFKNTSAPAATSNAATAQTRAQPNFWGNGWWGNKKSDWFHQHWHGRHNHQHHQHRGRAVGEPINDGHRGNQRTGALRLTELQNRPPRHSSKTPASVRSLSTRLKDAVSNRTGTNLSTLLSSPTMSWTLIPRNQPAEQTTESQVASTSPSTSISILSISSNYAPMDRTTVITPPGPTVTSTIFSTIRLSQSDSSSLEPPPLTVTSTKTIEKSDATKFTTTMATDELVTGPLTARQEPINDGMRRTEDQGSGSHFHLTDLGVHPPVHTPPASTMASLTSSSSSSSSSTTATTTQDPSSNRTGLDAAVSSSRLSPTLISPEPQAKSTPTSLPLSSDPSSLRTASRRSRTTVRSFTILVSPVPKQQIGNAAESADDVPATGTGGCTRGVAVVGADGTFSVPASCFAYKPTYFNLAASLKC